MKSLREQSRDAEAREEPSPSAALQLSETSPENPGRDRGFSCGAGGWGLCQAGHPQVPFLQAQPSLSRFISPRLFPSVLKISTVPGSSSAGDCETVSLDVPGMPQKGSVGQRLEGAHGPETQPFWFPWRGRRQLSIGSSGAWGCPHCSGSWSRVI